MINRKIGFWFYEFWVKNEKTNYLKFIFRYVTRETRITSRLSAS